MPVFKMEIFSPRWGHDDTYRLELSNDGLVFRQSIGPRPPVRMRHVENSDPVWENLHDLGMTFRNDHIYQPEILPRLFEHLWRAWRNHELSEDQVQEEAEALAAYINACNRAVPTTDFWRTVF